MELFFYLVLVIFSIAIADGSVTPTDQTNGQSLDDVDMIALEKDLPYINTFRMAGDWILRATSNMDKYFTRAFFELKDNKVIFHANSGRKSLASVIFRHSPNSKTIDLEKLDTGDQGRLIGLHQTDELLIYICSLPHQSYKALIVLVKNEVQPYINDNVFASLIADKLMTKPNVRQLLEPLLPSLEFVNRDLPKINYELQDFAISDEALIDCDLANSFGNWTLKATTSSLLENNFKFVVVSLESNRTIFHYSDGNNHSITVPVITIANTKVYRPEFYFDGQWVIGHVGVIYADKDSVAFAGHLLQKQEYLLAIYARSGSDFDSEYMKKVVENQILFSHDLRRLFKDSVPKMSWIA